MHKQCLTEQEAAQYIGMSRSYLRHDRMNGAIRERTPGPNYIKIGRSIRYRLNDLETWLEQHQIIR